MNDKYNSLSQSDKDLLDYYGKFLSEDKRNALINLLFKGNKITNMPYFLKEGCVDLYFALTLYKKADFGNMVKKFLDGLTFNNNICDLEILVSWLDKEMFNSLRDTYSLLLDDEFINSKIDEFRQQDLPRVGILSELNKELIKRYEKYFEPEMIEKLQKCNNVKAIKENIDKFIFNITAFLEGTIPNNEKRDNFLRTLIADMRKKNLEGATIFDEAQKIVTNFNIFNSKYKSSIETEIKNKSSSAFSLREIFDTVCLDESESSYNDYMSFILRQYEGRSVELKELFVAVYSNFLSLDKIESLYLREDIRKNFLMDINGCYSEANVGILNMPTEIRANDFSNISVKSTQDLSLNPLIFITDSCPVRSSIISKVGDYTFLFFSDLHIDKGCYGEKDGVLNEEMLQEKLDAFEKLRNIMVNETGATHVVFVGDFLEAFAVDNSFIINNSNRDELVAVFEKRKHNNVDCSYFTMGIIGNHDSTMGTDFNDASNRLESVVKSLFGDEEARIIGSGYARIMIGDRFLALTHFGSNDYANVEHKNSEARRDIRNNEKNSILFFEEYLRLCNAVYASGEYQVSNPEADNYLFSRVNEILKSTNEQLYSLLRPFIVCNLDFGKSDDMSDIEKKSFFELFIELDPKKDILKKGKSCKSNVEEIEFNDAGYEAFYRKNKRLNENGILNPFVVRNDSLRPLATVVAHYHNESEFIEKNQSGEITGAILVEPKGFVKDKTDGSYTLYARKMNIRVTNDAVLLLGVEEVAINSDLTQLGVRSTTHQR